MRLALPAATTLIFFFSSLSSVSAGTGTLGDPCSQGDNRLQAGSYQFWSDCTATHYCATDGTCQPKGCKRDDFPFGYAQESTTIPDKCPRGEFCPDEGDACQPLLAVGSPCQLNRDDECEAPENFRELTDRTGRGLNVNGTVCLNNVCMWANATLGTSCVVENTAYIGYSSSGEFINIVSRGNCRVGLYCDSQQLVCMNERAIGESCDADKECSTWNCLGSGVCGGDAANSNHVAVWVYVVVGIAIFGGMFGTLFTLFALHRRNRDQEREKRAQYWREQNAFHQNLLQMRETARMSVLSLPQGGSARSTMYSRDGVSDESHSPILHNAAAPPKSSGLRHLADDGSSEFDESLMMHQPRRTDDNRF